MTQLRLLKTCAAFVFTVTSLLSNADAAVVNLNLTGNLSNAVVDYSTYENRQYATWYVDLIGLNPNGAVVVSQGDSLNVTIALDRSFSLLAPTSSSLGIGTWLFGQFNVQSNQTGTVQLFNGGVVQMVSAPVSGATGGAALANFGSFQNTSAINFDLVKSNFRIDQLASPVVVNASRLQWTVTSPVPEPNSYIMMLGGGLAIFATLRRKRS